MNDKVSLLEGSDDELCAGQRDETEAKDCQVRGAYVLSTKGEKRYKLGGPSQEKQEVLGVLRYEVMTLFFIFGLLLSAVQGACQPWWPSPCDWGRKESTRKNWQKLTPAKSGSQRPARCRRFPLKGEWETKKKTGKGPSHTRGMGLVEENQESSGK